MAKLMKKIGDPDHLVVFSDRDDHTWSDFNWRYLANQMLINRVPLEADRRDPVNTFVDRVEVAGGDDPGASDTIFGVDIVRTGSAAAEQLVRLEARIAGRVVAKETFSFDQGQTGERLQLAVSKDQLDSVEGSVDGSPEGQLKSPATTPIEWKIVPEQDDAFNKVPE